MFIFAAETGGLFGIFENNLINWLLLVAILIYMWMRITPGLFASRKSRIEQTLAEAAEARKEGQAFLEEQRKKIENAEHEAESILVEAKRVASEMKQQIAEETRKESADLQERITHQIEGERRLAITELRSQAATAAVRLAEATLPGAMTDSARSRLLNEFVEQLNTVGAKK
ncbi:MAG: hypothetical protein K2W82_03915 [Candidatus Obscuribacterales bacterium]|nr:hypothetical protein [Candidatus Obscuribacterales bacterium]